MIKKVFFLTIFFLFTIISWRAFQSHIFNFHFVDEDENIVAGYYMTKGEKLYSDIFSHKQPLPAVISMAEQKIQRPNSLYLLIKRHREFVYFYSFIWSVILILAFGSVGLIFSLSVEIVKQFLLGNLFLSESLILFPLVLLIGLLIKIIKKKTLCSHLDLSLISLSSILIIFLQFTLIPLVVAALTTTLMITKKKRYFFFFTVFLGLIFFVTIGFFVDYREYLVNTKNAISSIYLTGNSVGGPGKMILNSVLRPAEIMRLRGMSDWLVFQKGLSIVYLFSFFLLFVTKKELRKTLFAGFVFLGLANLRITDPEATFYGGFHGLPWLGLFLWLTIWQLFSLPNDNVGKKMMRKNLVSYVLVLICVVGFWRFGSFLINDYYRKTNRETDWYVNFSRLYDFGQTIKILSKPGDKLMVLPAEQLIYWQSGLPHASRFLYVYLFINPKYKKELYEYWEKSPPEFLYDEQNMDLFKKWQYDYIRVKRENNDTPLFIRKDKLQELEVWQLEGIKLMKFSI
ncbi:MAG: hypothetical protein M1575_00385 [Patescibacteria group bacterium]|nr:hypothetical protein [Patescibacteria group bacterium]MCL5095183.1 hypothetical protein [Patescibacteria group bacterium]